MGDTVKQDEGKGKRLLELAAKNGHKWAKQEFDNGISWMSYYKNTFYLIQMFGKDKEIYESDCKKDFDKIKDSFTFMKNE